ncbi:sigma-70 family RNA polymerase sigma factor [Streptomyces sp. NPDC051207]|uniref:sigma-70 family RNA polymerase sigma factor n=1 Tax=Streptomyces sp. NPDC051207 TaxID=3154641 RepID=UPI00341F52E0
MRRTTDLVPGPSGPGTCTPTGSTSGPRADESSTSGEEFVRRIYAEHGALLLRYAARLLGGDWHRAEDILQEAALRAWKRSTTLGLNVTEARPWMFTVVKNLVIDHRRARSIRPPENSSLDVLRTDPCQDGTIERFLTSHTVLEAFEDLTEQHRDIIKLMYYLECSVAQVADHLGIPPGTVKSRSYYALRALKKALHDRGVTP